MKKGESSRRLVRTAQERRRPYGSYIRFDNTAVVIINEQRPSSTASSCPLRGLRRSGHDIICSRRRCCNARFNSKRQRRVMSCKTCQEAVCRVCRARAV